MNFIHHRMYYNHNSNEWFNSWMEFYEIEWNERNNMKITKMKTNQWMEWNNIEWNELNEIISWLYQ